MCEQKRRFTQKRRTQSTTRISNVCKIFMNCVKNLVNQSRMKTFCKSAYYSAFVKFGSFISNVKPLYPMKYIDYVVTSGVKLDHWCREEMYLKYAGDLILREPVETAMERSIKTMMDWGR